MVENSINPKIENEDDEFERLLNDFISTQLDDVETGLEIKPQEPEKPQIAKTKESIPFDGNEDDGLSILLENEKALFKAYINFKDSINILVEDNKLKSPKFCLTHTMLYPFYKPQIGKIMAEDTILGWDVMIKTLPEILNKISPSASDEDLLDFAEGTDNDAMQFALISYVEVLIEMEGCEIGYKEKKLRYEKRKLERKVYEEHYKRIERAKRYIEAISEKKFPINAERLVKNYFKNAQKDAEAAFKVLTQNPAVFAPIELDKVKPRCFGFIKVKPQDGYRINRIIGDFLKKLKA